MKKVLVTGASGFIGRHTLKTLIERGFDVHAVSSKHSEIISKDCTWHTANLLDPSQTKELLSAVKPTHLLHFAWYATPGKYWTSEENFRWVQASLELLKQFREQGGERVVMAGTCAEYDWNYGYCSESLTPTKPNSVYGTCKKALQEMLAAYSELTGINSAWGRIFFLYGSYEHPNRLVSSVIRSLLRGEPAFCSHGNQIRDFLFVQDVADAFVAILDSNITGVINIASGQPITIKDVVYKIGEKINKLDLIRLGAIQNTLQETALLVADCGRLSNEINWVAKYNLDTGLEKTIDWCKEHIYEGKNE